MEQKSRIRRIINRYIELGYDTGCWQSTIIHSVLFIFLALIIIQEEPAQKLKPIIISFTSPSANTSTFDEPAISINFPELSIEENTFTPSLLSEQIPIEIPIPNPLVSELPKGENKNNDIKDLLFKPENLMQKIAVDTNEQETPNESDQSRPVDRSLSRSKTNNSRSIANNTNRKQNNRPSSTNELMSLISAGTTLGSNIPPNNFASSTSQMNSMSQGISDNIEQRLQQYGAQTGDIQISIMWNTFDDIDLHVTFQNNNINESLSWRNRSGISGGRLDIDMNGPHKMTDKAVENIFWPHGRSPSGIYTVGIVFFRSWTGRTSVPVTVRIKTLKGVATQNIVLNYGSKRPVVIDTFSN